MQASQVTRYNIQIATMPCHYFAKYVCHKNFIIIIIIIVITIFIISLVTIINVGSRIDRRCLEWWAQDGGFDMGIGA